MYVWDEIKPFCFFVKEHGRRRSIMWNVGGGVAWQKKRVDTSDLTLIPVMIHKDVSVIISQFERAVTAFFDSI
jgi:hypothetical protein